MDRRALGGWAGIAFVVLSVVGDTLPGARDPDRRLFERIELLAPAVGAMLSRS